VPENPDSPVKLPNLDIPAFKVLARVFQRGGVIGRDEVIASNDLARCSHCERPIVRHRRTPPQCLGKVATYRAARQLSNGTDAAHPTLDGRG